MVKELERRQRIRQMLYSWPSLAVLAVLAFFLIKGAVGIMRIERDSAGRVKALEAQASQLSLREKELEASINKLRTQEGIMEEIKNKFSVTREGEYVAIIVDPKSKATTTSTSTAAWLKGAWESLKSLWSGFGSGYNSSQ